MLGTVNIGRSYNTNSDGFNQKSNFTEDDYQRKLFLGGLSPNSTEESIANFYRQFGEVANVVIKRDPTTQRSKGFGFITYKDSTSIEGAQAVRPHIIDGKVVDSKPALPRGEASKIPNTSSTDRKIFIGGLKDTHDEESLKRYFEKFGSILAVKILVDRNTGRKRGFAFVEFSTSDGVEKAVILKNHTINELMVEVKKSNYKHDQARRMTSPAITTPNTAAMPGSYAVTSYTQTPYTHPSTAGYNNWGTSTAIYPPQSQTTYGGYATILPQTDMTPAWNGQWCQQVYGSTQPNVTTSVNTNDWNVQPQPAETYYAHYQQSYNGGPQKVAYLQGNRMNPYST